MVGLKRYFSNFNHFYPITFINSLGFAFLSYFFVRGFLLLINYLTANAIGVSYYRIFLDFNYTTPSSSDIWTYSNIITIYLMPAMLSGMIFILVFILYRTRLKYIKGTHKLFWLWILLQTSIMTLGGIIASVTSEKGTYYAFQWMYLPYASMMIISLLCFIAMVFIGWVIGKNFLYITESHKLINNLTLQKKHLFYSLLLPSLACHITVYLTQLKAMDKYNTVLIVCGFVATLPILFQPTKIKLTILRNDKLQSFSRFALAGIVTGIILLFLL